MTRTRTALACAAVAATLAAGTLTAGAGTTGAQWHASDSLWETTFGTGTLEIAGTSSGFTAASYELDDGKSRTFDGAVTARMTGTTLDAAVLRVSYAWRSRSMSLVGSWSNLHGTVAFGSTTVTAAGSFGNAAGKSAEVLLLRDGAPVPPGRQAMPIVRFTGDSFSLDVKLTMTNNVGGAFFYGWTLDQGAAQEGYGMTATLTQVLPNGADGAWQSVGRANLTKVENTLVVTDDAVAPAPASAQTGESEPREQEPSTVMQDESRPASDREAPTENPGLPSAPEPEDQTTENSGLPSTPEAGDPNRTDDSGLPSAPGPEDQVEEVEVQAGEVMGRDEPVEHPSETPEQSDDHSVAEPQGGHDGSMKHHGSTVPEAQQPTPDVTDAPEATNDSYPIDRDDSSPSGDPAETDGPALRNDEEMDELAWRKNAEREDSALLQEDGLEEIKSPDGEAT